MLRAFVVEAGCLNAVDAAAADPARIVWYDLLNPSRAEEELVESRMAIDVPTREEAEHFDISSRLYQDGGALYMSEDLLNLGLPDGAGMSTVTLILKGSQIVSLRYDAFPAIDKLLERCQRPGAGISTSAQVLRAIVEHTVDQIGHCLEGVGKTVDGLSRRILRARSKATSDSESRAFRSVLLSLGETEDLVAKSRDSLVNISRMSVFLTQNGGSGPVGSELVHFLRSEGKDMEALAQYGQHLSGKIGFLLETTIGLVTIEQNTIIKIFSVVAFAILPPTLVASVYGMNFRHMPELEWVWGYPMALGLMVLAGVLPLLVFKAKGWL